MDFSWEQFYLGMISYILFLFFVWPPQRSLKCMTCSIRDPIYCLTSGLDVMSSTLGQRVVKVIQAFFTLTCDQNWVTWVRSWFLTLYTTTTSSLHYDLFFVRSPVPICSITYSVLPSVSIYSRICFLYYHLFQPTHDLSGCTNTCSSLVYDLSICTTTCSVCFMICYLLSPVCYTVCFLYYHLFQSALWSALCTVTCFCLPFDLLWVLIPVSVCSIICFPCSSLLSVYKYF